MHKKSDMKKSSFSSGSADERECCEIKRESGGYTLPSESDGTDIEPYVLRPTL